MQDPLQAPAADAPRRRLDAHDVQVHLIQIAQVGRRVIRVMQGAQQAPQVRGPLAAGGRGGGHVDAATQAIRGL